MAVEQDVRALIACRRGVVSDDHGMPSGGAHFGAEAEANELVAHPFGGTLAVSPVIRLRADRGYPQQLEQPPLRGVQRGISVMQDRGEGIGRSG